jgi:hypothetical protein
MFRAAAFTFACALAACAPSNYLAPRLARAPPAASFGDGGGTWWEVLIHAHSVLNFVWVYDRPEEILEAERADRKARDAGRLGDMRNYDPRGIADLLERAARRGADALVLTEHNTLIHAQDALLPDQRGKTRLFRRASEWTAWKRGGHALLLGLRTPMRPSDSRRATADDFRRMVSEARAQGAVVVVCHPTTPGSPWKDAGLPEGAHAVEVLNSWPFDGRGSEALWHAALRRGDRLGAVGGADWHATAGPPIPGAWRVTQVRSPALSEADLYAAIAAGRTVAVNGHRPGLALRLRVAGCREGDVCPVRGDEPLLIEVEARGAGGLTLEIFDEHSESPSDPAARLPVVGPVFRAAFRRSPPGGRGFVRAALRASSTVALGSPVYLEAR